MFAGSYSSTLGVKSLIITPELRRISSTPAALASQALRSLFLRTLDDAIVEKMNSERAWSDCVDTLHFTNGVSFQRLIR